MGGLRRMKKSIFKLLIGIGIISACLAGCSAGRNSSRNGSVLLKDGVLSWKANDKAVCYEVEMGASSINCEETELELSKLCKYEGEHTITVSMITDSNKKSKKQIGTLDIVAKKLEKPAISIIESDEGETILSWKTQAEAGDYGYDFNDGKGIREAEVGEDQLVKVTVPDDNQRMITITVESTSKDNTYYIGNEVTYRYQGKVLFELSKIAQYPFYSISNGVSGEKLTAAVDLPKGTYTLDIMFAVMDVNGKSLSGNGRWGRFATIEGASGEMWFCENEIDDGSRIITACKDTLRPANETITYTKEVAVNKYGEFYITINSFKVNEMLLITDIQLDGKSVMASGLKKHDPEDDAQFDTAKLEEFLAVFESKGTGHNTHPQNDYFSIPINLPDGSYEVQVKYQIMDKDGKKLSGNGLWGRRIGNENMGDLVWYCDYELKPHTEGAELPTPTRTLTSNFRVKVQGGKFNLLCLNFNLGEIVGVQSVKKISGSSSRFNMSTLSSYKNVYVEKTEGSTTELKIQTNLTRRGMYDLEVTYYLADKDGYKCYGNGVWGRRVVPVGTEEILWLCDDQIDNGGNMVGEADSIPEPNKPVTETITVAMNKKGVLALNMHSFLEGEMFIIKDITYNGNSILGK